MLYEYRNSLERFTKPNLMPFWKASGQPGFISVFGFPGETANVIINQGSTKNLDNLPLHSDTLYLDFDSDEGIESAINYITNNNLQAEIYTTGNRGKHIHIPIMPITLIGLANKLKGYVASTFPGADLSIYKPTGIIRNVGTWHSKNPGHRKELIEVIPGFILDPKLKESSHTFKIFKKDTVEDADNILTQLLLAPIQEGNRNNKVYNLTYLARESGITKQEASNLLTEYNRNYVLPPLRDRELLTIINSCYGA
jgi:hypothetical protein